MPFLFYSYRLLTWLVLPVSLLFLHLRVLRGRENASRLNERFGRAVKQKPDGKLIWVHAASVGEVVSVLPLIDIILEDNASFNILLTSGTLTSANIVAEQPRDRMIHQFIPLDIPVCVKRFIRHWKPDAAFFVESEIWPNLLNEMNNTGKPIALVNGRCSSNSFSNWKRAPDTIKKLLSFFTLLLAQDEVTAERFKELGGQNIFMQGNLKLDAASLPFDETEHKKLTKQIGGRQVWLAASTHNPEEYKTAKSHIIIKSEHKNLLTIIVPRHPNRGNDIRLQCEELGLSVAQRSLGEPITPKTDIYLGDTIGEMGLYYRLTEIAFIGGSLIPHGGQNPIEAAQIGAAIIIGPHIDNFTTIYQHFEKANANITVRDDVELTTVVNRLLNDKKTILEMKKRAADTVKMNNGAMKKIYQTLKAILPTGEDR